MNLPQAARRLFVALPISRDLQGMILPWQMQYTKLPVRWLAGKNLHITLVPPWYAKDPNETADILASIQTGIQPFRVAFERVTFGPDPDEPRLIWAEGDAPAPVLKLKTALAQALHEPEEKRPFRLHLTLARFRPELFSSFPLKHLADTVAWTTTIHSFALMESHLSPRGADYEILKEIPLASP